MTNNVILRRRKLGRGSSRGICEASTRGITTIRNWTDSFPAGEGIVFRWGCTSNVPNGYKVVNTAESIHWCSNKRHGRIAMQAAGVPVPKTWDRWMEMVADKQSASRPAKVVLRPARHAQGRNLFVFDWADRQLASKCSELGEFYISELINKVAEFRVFVCQNRVVWVAKKTPGNPDQVAWNVAQGGRFDNVRWNDWHMPTIKAALAAAKVSGTDFCGVDVMVDADGNPYVLEVNSAPSQTSAYRQGCVAKAFDYIIEHGKDALPDVPDGPRRTWKSYIHPSLKE